MKYLYILHFIYLMLHFQIGMINFRSLIVLLLSLSMTLMCLLLPVGKRQNRCKCSIHPILSKLKYRLNEWKVFIKLLWCITIQQPVTIKKTCEGVTQDFLQDLKYIHLIQILISNHCLSRNKQCLSIIWTFYISSIQNIIFYKIYWIIMQYDYLSREYFITYLKTVY